MIHDLYQETHPGPQQASPELPHRWMTRTARREGYNPLCGDKLKLFLKVDENGIVKDVSFVGSGCADLRLPRLR